MRSPLRFTAASPAEVAAAMPGDRIVDPADVVMDRAFTLEAAPAQVWPWIEQLGKARAGWYLPRVVERPVPRARRALRSVDPRFLGLAVGDVIPDYGGSKAYFEVAEIDRPGSVVYRSVRGHTRLTWAIALTPVASAGSTGTRVRLRLRLAPVRRPWLAASVGGLVDALTIAGLVAGLRERLGDSAAGRASPDGRCRP